MVHTVSERDAAALLEVVSELDRLDDPLPFPPRFLALLADLIGVGDVAYSVLDRRNGRGVSCSSWNDGEELVVVGHGPGADEYMRHRRSHPVCSYRERTGDWGTVHTVSDFATQSEFRRTEIWNRVYRHDGINYWLDVGLPVERATTRVFIFTHGTRDFADRERLLLELLQPHLARRAHILDRAAAATESLAAVEEAGDEARDVVLATSRGTIEFASQRSRELLRRYFGIANGTLPGSLLRGTVVGRAPGGRLTVRAAPVDGLVVLLLGEDDERAELLTPRQREILGTVAQGLTDAQIADRLGIAPATVNKHLESIYERLGVHTRTAAAAALRG